jgi:hypothetical protein
MAVLDYAHSRLVLHGTGRDDYRIVRRYQLPALHGYRVFTLGSGSLHHSSLTKTGDYTH